MDVSCLLFLLLFGDNWLQMSGIYSTQRDLYLKVNADLHYQPSNLFLLKVILIYSFVSKVLRILQWNKNLGFLLRKSDLKRWVICVAISTALRSLTLQEIYFIISKKKDTEFAYVPQPTCQLYWRVNQCTVESRQNQNSALEFG